MRRTTRTSINGIMLINGERRFFLTKSMRALGRGFSLGVELAEQFRAEGLEVDGERLDVAAEKTVGDQRRDGHEETRHGAVHRLGDPGGDNRALGGKVGGVAGSAEDADQAEDRAHQPEKRSESGDDLEENEP